MRCRCAWHQIGLYDVVGRVARVQYVPILEEDGAPTPLELEDALPLGALLAPLATHKDGIAAALEALEPDPPAPQDTGTAGDAAS